MIPERSVVGKSARSVFFEEINDIDIYIEDTAFGYEKIYSVLFSRVFDGKYRVDRVFPLGGRKSVIDQFSNSITTLTRPSLFVIDGDLLILAGKSEENQKGLYRLPFYCIENILCDAGAISDLLHEEDPIKSRELLINEFDYDNWLRVNESKLFNLFVEYAITFTVNPTEQTVAYRIINLVSGNDGFIDDKKLKKRIEYLQKEAIDKVGVVQYEVAKKSILTRFNTSLMDEIDIASGKDYILPLIKTRFKSIVKTRIPDINFKIRLAMKCDIDKIKKSDLFVAC